MGRARKVHVSTIPKPDPRALSPEFQERLADIQERARLLCTELAKAAADEYGLSAPPMVEGTLTFLSEIETEHGWEARPQPLAHVFVTEVRQVESYVQPIGGEPRPFLLGPSATLVLGVGARPHGEEGA